MASVWTHTPSQVTLPSLAATLFDHSNQGLTKDELAEVLRALELPFPSNLVQWRLMESSEDGTRGLMLPYADPRAYSDRLNNLFTPAGWTRKYTVQASAPVQRPKRVPAAKILVTCEVTIGCIGNNSGNGEEWSDKRERVNWCRSPGI